MNDQSNVGLNPTEQAAENIRISREAEEKAAAAMQQSSEDPLLPSLQESIKAKLDASETFAEDAPETEEEEVEDEEGDES